MKKAKIKPAQLEKFLESHSLCKYDMCKICNISAITAERWSKNGIPESQYRLIALSVGAL